MKKLTTPLFIVSLLTSPIWHSAQATHWDSLELTDEISVIAPGNGSHDGSVEKAREVIGRFGFRGKIPDDLINPTPLCYANTTQYCATHLQQELNNPQTKVIWALRGGRGSSRILPYLENIALGNHPSSVRTSTPLIVGFSDITALHLWATVRGLPSLHAPVLAYNKESAHIVNEDASLQDVFDILTGKVTELEYTCTPLNQAAQQEDLVMNTSIVGGNISLIQRSIGTDTELEAKGKILFLEETGEPATKFAEVLYQLDRSHVFDSPAAVFWGNLAYDNKEHEKYQYLKNEFATLFNERGIPFFQSDNFGHGKKNSPLPFNTPAILSFENPDEVRLKIRTNN